MWQVLGEPYGAASDAWSFGVLSFEILTLRKPFVANSLAELSTLIANSRYDEAALERCGRHPPELLRIVSRDGLLNPDPVARINLGEVDARLLGVAQTCGAGGPQHFAR